MPFLFGSLLIENYNCSMNQESVCLTKTNSAQIETVSFEKIPHQSKLFLDFQVNDSELGEFYPQKSADLRDFAKVVLTNYTIDRQKLCDILLEINESFQVSGKTLENIELLRDEKSVAIVTGQQAGLFSGELYTIYKALSAVKLAEDLRRQNINVVPIFWIAEEDHDFDEVKKTSVLNKDATLIKVENTPQNYFEGVPVGRVKFDETIQKTIEELFENLSQTEFSAETKNLLTETYTIGETYSTAFAKFLAKLFADFGLIFLSPLNEKLKQLCAPVFAEAIEKSENINSALLEKNRELENQNYAAQVLVNENSFPFFYQENYGKRLALKRDGENSVIKIQNSKRQFTKAELLEIAQKTPQNLSPNALLRPIVQDYLLPTLTYIGGAAEIAYFAQNSAIYKILNRPPTPIRHRASLTIVQRKHARTFEKYDLTFEELFEGKEKILAEIVEKFLANETAQTFTEIEETINAQLNQLEKSLIEIEPTLADNLVNRSKKINWHLDSLRKKYHLAEIRKNEVVKRRIDSLFTALYPNNALQERTLNVVTFLNLYGTNFIDWVYQAIDSDEKNHQILYL